MQYNIEKIVGIDCLFYDMPDANSITFQIFVDAGSTYEDLVNHGIAHAMEHMFFKGGKKYKTPMEVAQAVDKFGGEFNAYTNTSYVSYYIKSSPEFVEQAIDVISDMINDAKFDIAELEREKGVILQEIAMYEDDPRDVISDKRNLRWFGDNSIGRPVIGTKESVMGINRNMLLEYKQNLYSKDNMLICIVGNIGDKSRIRALIAKNFDGLPSKKIIMKPSFGLKLPSDRSFVYYQKTHQNHLIISANGFKRNDGNKFPAKILTTILGGNMSSRLFQNVREKHGLCYYIGASHSTDTDFGVFRITAGLGKDRFEFGLEKIIQELDSISSDGISTSEYNNAIGFLIGKFGMGLESSNEIADFLGSQYICYREILTLEDLKTEYQKTTIDQVNEVAKKMLKNNIYRCWTE